MGFMVFFASNCFSAETKAYLQNGSIMVENEDGIRSIDYSQSNKYQRYDLKKWRVREEGNPVQEALSVYNKKAAPLYKTKLWIIDKGNSGEKIFIEYSTTGNNNQVIFSPEEDIIFYLDVSLGGDQGIYGLNLLTKDKFFVDYAEHFVLTTCNDQTTYLVIEKDGGQVYYIYNLDGERINMIPIQGVGGNIQERICY